MQSTILIAIFNTAQSVFPCFINSAVSKLKVENVLNPPQIPVSKNNLKGVDSNLMAKYFKPMAKMSAAMMLANNVAIGSGNVDR